MNKMGFRNCLNCGKDISDIMPGAGGKISGMSGDYCDEACWEGHIRGFTKEPPPAPRNPQGELLTAAQRAALGGLVGPEGGGSES